MTRTRATYRDLVILTVPADVPCEAMDAMASQWRRITPGVPVAIVHASIGVRVVRGRRPDHRRGAVPRWAR